MIKKDSLAVSRWITASLIVVFLVGSYFAYPWLRTRIGRMRRLSQWLHDPSAHLDWMVRAAYSGYPTRLPDWKSTVIVRIPADPLVPNRQIWAYYTHMADNSGISYISPEFPTGTSEVFVEPGTFLGYQGDFSGDPGNPVGVHSHFSIVLDDGQGSFRNELKIENTLDPTPYLGLSPNASQDLNQVIICTSH